MRFLEGRIYGGSGMGKEIEIAKAIITTEIEKVGLKVIKIILFGSRARGDFNKDSDWDLLVIVDKDIEPYQKRRIIGEIYRALAKLENSYEIIITSQADFEKRKKVIGYISYEANREGIVI